MSVHSKSDPSDVTKKLSENLPVFRDLLSNMPKEEYLYRPAPEKWCALEIVCHLVDEEREDFRARTRHVLEQPDAPLPSIDPVGWVTSRQYITKDFHQTLSEFLMEREASVRWLQSLKDPDWNRTHHHLRFGPMSAKMFLVNWLAHDLLHLRQIIRLKYDSLATTSGESMKYAGDW